MDNNDVDAAGAPLAEVVPAAAERAHADRSVAAAMLDAADGGATSGVVPDAGEPGAADGIDGTEGLAGQAARAASNKRRRGSRGGRGRSKPRSAGAPGNQAIDDDSLCSVEEIGFKRVIRGPTRTAVKAKVDEMMNFCAVAIGDIEQIDGQWVAMCDTAGIQSTGIRW